MTRPKYRDWSPEVLQIITDHQPIRAGSIEAKLIKAIRGDNPDVKPFRRVDAALQKLRKQGKIRVTYSRGPSRWCLTEDKA